MINQKGDRIYTFTRERMKWHKEQGHIVIAISGSPMELVSKMAMKYKMDDFRGTIYETDELGRYNEMLFRCGIQLVNKRRLMNFNQSMVLIKSKLCIWRYDRGLNDVSCCRDNRLRSIQQKS